MADNNNNNNNNSDDVAMVSGDEENASPGTDQQQQQQESHQEEEAAAPTMEETVREDDDDQQQQQQQAQEDLQNATMGGTVNTPCFCLLDGIIDLTTTTPTSTSKKDESSASNNNNKNTNHKSKERLSVPITRLPAILGRAHQTDNVHFIPLGSFTTISRQHCKIEYWCCPTGRLEQQSNNDNDKKEGAAAAAGEFSYVPQKEKIKFVNKDKIVLEEEADSNYKPFFTITCLGKNRIFVNKEKLEKGETAILSNGAAIRLSNTCFLYFFLPTTNQQQQSSSSTNKNKTMEIEVSPPPPPPPTKKRKTSFTVTSSGLTAKGGDNNTTKTLATAAAGIAAAAAPQTKKRGRGVSHIQAELDKLSNDELRRQLTAAIQDDIWERRHQLIGSTLSGRAILAVAQDPTLRNKCSTEQGLSRGEIMDWIAQSKEFAEWSQQMLNKLETKSYQSSITKAMIKAGFTRTASTGRYIKWMLPDMKLNTVTGKVKNKSAEQADDAQDAANQEDFDVEEENHDKEDEVDKHDESKEEEEKEEQADENESDNENEEDNAKEEDGHNDVEDNRKEGDDELMEQETSETKDEQAKIKSGGKQDDEEVVSWSIREP